ncbi:MAG TPA: rhomboid family intramembrane serine protease [bacterium]|nr:rhomboid family intramembrane serine protease [bacterium]
MFFVLPVQEGNPPKKFPFVNLGLIALNFYVFFRTFFRPDFDRLVDLHGFVPLHPHLRDVLTSMFLHAGFAHLLGNMYFLYVFGDMVEAKIGRANYLLAYLLSGLGACYLQFAVDPRSPIPLVGASGAISGICALYMIYFPWQRMRLQFFFLIFPLFSLPARAFLVVGFWILEQYLMAVSSTPQMGGVAFWAHVGGFLTGIALLFFVTPSKKRTA